MFLVKIELKKIERQKSAFYIGLVKA